jgi:hypothetical protein
VSAAHQAGEMHKMQKQLAGSTMVKPAEEICVDDSAKPL